MLQESKKQASAVLSSKMPLLVTTPSREKALQENPQIFLQCELKIIFR